MSKIHRDRAVELIHNEIVYLSRLKQDIQMLKAVVLRFGDTDDMRVYARMQEEVKKGFEFNHRMLEEIREADEDQEGYILVLSEAFERTGEAK